MMSTENLSQLDEGYDLRVTGSFKIGRSPLCDIILKDSYVSKAHCTLNISRNDDPHSSDGANCEVLISDHSSNGTWILPKSGGETRKLEKEKPTLLKDSDVILLTRSTGLNPEVISYKYHSSPFPRITKFSYKPGQLLDQSSTELPESTSDIVQKDQQDKTNIYPERKRKADVQPVSARKVRFKLQSEENTDNQEPLMECSVENIEQSTERVDVCTDASYTVTDDERSTVKESDNTILDVDQTSGSDEERGAAHATTSPSHIPISSSTESLSGLHVSKVLKSTFERDSERPRERDVTKHSVHKRTSGASAPGDGSEYDKCTQCGKWIPHVTLSLHEAVCEGQSQEYKSQDHVSLPSLESGSLREDSIAEVQNSAVKGDAGETDASVCSEESESDRSVKITRVDDDSCKQKIVEKQTNRPSTSYGNSSESNITDKSNVVSYDLEKKLKEKPAQNLTSDSHCEVTTPISTLGSEPALEREESKERCTFCSTLLPVSKLIQHASECSKMSAVPCAASDDLESMREGCPYCGKYFVVLELVEHVSHCEDLSRLVAEEVSRLDDPYASPSPEVSGSDSVGDTSRSDRELCPKCRREFPILELVSHATECKEEVVSSGAESLRGDADEEGVERFDDTESKEGNSDDASESSGRYCDERKVNDHDCSHDEAFSDITDKKHDSSSTCDDVEVVKGAVSENGESTVSDEEDNADVGVSERDDVVTSGDSYNDDGRDESQKSDTIYEEYEIHESDAAGELSSRWNSCRGNECVDAVVDPGVDVGSDEFEFCPNCRKLFHLSRLVEHASTCVTGAETATYEKSTTSDPPTDTSIVFCDCHYCGIRLPVDIMSSHYPKCEKQYLEKSSSEESGRFEESGVPAGDLLACAKRIDDLSSRVTPGTLDVKHKTRATERNDFEESPEALKNKVVRLDDNGKETDQSKEVVLKRTTSSLDSYRDCEEQCVYCLKMFAVSVLVEHARVCADLQQSSVDSNDLEQCCYCLQTFPVNELISHAPNCDQRTIHSSQENSQDDDVANSQSSGGELLERCMYCFKDFPVSKLIRHSQKCDGDMSGPRERFQGFLPSVHDLSAISSVAVLNDTQREALQYVIRRSAQDSKRVAPALLARVQVLGYSEIDLKRTLQWVRSAAPIIIHINLDRVLRFLVEDSHYRNRFETGTSGGSTDKVARKSWEDRIFNNAYHGSSPMERVKYGVLNIVGDPRGVRSCIHYGDSFLQLKKVRLRTTFASMDTSGEGVKLSCCEHYENVLYAYTDNEITAIMDVATGKVPFHRSDCISQYKEVQIHGPVSLSENVECIVVNPRHQRDPRITNMLDRFVEQNNCNLIWMDPDDVSGATPFSFGGMSHYASAGSLVRLPSRTRVRVRPRCHKGKHRH